MVKYDVILRILLGKSSCLTLLECLENFESLESLESLEILESLESLESLEKMKVLTRGLGLNCFSVLKILIDVNNLEYLSRAVSFSCRQLIAFWF